MEKLLEVLKYGIENAKTAKMLELETGIKPREQRLIFNELRRKGICICSGNCGYWLPKSEEEVIETTKRLDAMAINTKRVSNAIKESYGIWG